MAERKKIRVSFEGDQGVAHAEFASQCDVNNIVNKWRKGGQITHVKTGQPFYGDFTSGADFHETLNRVNAAREAFMGLPAAVRSACQNDPAQFIERFEAGDLEVLKGLGLELDADQGDTTPNVTDPVTEEPPATEGS